MECENEFQAKVVMISLLGGLIIMAIALSGVLKF